MKDELREIVREYHRFRQTGRLSAASTYRLPDGRVMELCQTNGRDWTLCAVRPDDSALTPVAFGDNIDALMTRYQEILPAWDPAVWPPVRVIVEGVARVFAPAGMSLLLGAVEFRQGVLLIGVVKRAATSGLALLHVDAGRVRVVHYGSPMDLRSVDMDGLLDLEDGPLRVETGELDPALLAAFARLLARALKPRKRLSPRRRGTGSIHLFMWAIVQLVRRGVEDLYGRLSDIGEQMKALVPGFDLPSEALGDNLALMLGAKTYLVAREDRVMWRLRLSDLNKVGSAPHQRFCAETPEIVADVDDFARVCAVDTPPARAKYRGARRSVETTATEVRETPPPEASEPSPVLDPVLLAFLHMALDRCDGLIIPASATVVAAASTAPEASSADPAGGDEEPPITG